MPVERRNRTAIALADATMLAAISGSEMSGSRPKKLPKAPPTLAGFSTDGQPYSPPGANAPPNAVTAIVAPASHAAGRQRGEGSRPSGNRRRPKVVIKRTPVPPSQLVESQAL